MSGPKGLGYEPRTRSSAAMLILDMISDFEFEGGDELFEFALPAAVQIATLAGRARNAGVPVIYVNDNYGKWDEDFKTYLSNVKRRSEQGRRIAEILEPRTEDFFILKPQRSGFYATPLGVFLGSMSVATVVVTGVTTDICVLFTAHDAHMRGHNVAVPSDCCAAIEQSFHKDALTLLARVAKADTRCSDDISFSESNKPTATADT